MKQSWRPWLWLLLGVVCCVAMVWPARVFATSLPSPGHLFVGAARRHVGRRFIDVGGVWWLLYAVAVVALLRGPRRWSAAVGVLTSIGVGAASIGRAPTTSNDFHRYAWDGRIQAAGIDPYRYAPNAPQLDGFHDSWLWPSASTCAVHQRPPGCTLINRPGVHTIYPPLAQLWFLIEHVAIPQSTRDRGYETVGLILVVVTTGLLLGFLHQTGRDIRQVAIWGCCPAVAIEAVQNAHVDALAVIFVVLAVWWAERGQWMWAAAAVGAAGLVKLYPLVLFPAIVQTRRIKGGALVVVMFAVGYLPHVLAIGSGVTGFLHTYVKQEGYVGGKRYQLLHFFGLHGHVAVVVAVVIVVIALALAAARAIGSPAQAAMVLFAVLLFVASPGEPWEDLTLVALAATTCAWKWLTVVIAEQAGYIAFLFGGIKIWTSGFGYALALAVALVAPASHTALRSRNASHRRPQRRT